MIVVMKNMVFLSGSGPDIFKNNTQMFNFFNSNL